MKEINRPLPWERRPAAGAVLFAAAVVTVGWLMYTPEGLLGKADAIGYAVCHQIDLRSFHMGDRAISLCARCTGMYLGALLGLAVLQIRSPRRGGVMPGRVNAFLGLLALFFALDGLNSFTNLIPGFPSVYTTTNTIRVFAGTGFGLVMAAFLFPAFNQTVWTDWTDEPPVRDLRDLASLLGLGALTAAIILTGNPLILYPASLLSAAAPVLILTMVYSLVVLIVFKKENFAGSPGKLAVPLLIGFTTAMVQIAAIDLLRFFITGTWDGFHLG
ncbi:MAG TPA: DUF2085 domain-containing protein [Anaerolineales bacterium]|nr:DUF2085 domain-containing protein [Anaerolineales bacterium]